MAIKFLFAIIVLLTAITGIVAFSLLLAWGNRRNKGFLQYLFYPVIFNLLWQETVVTRNLFLPETEDNLYTGQFLPPHVIWISRFTSLLVLVCIIEHIASYLIQIERKPKIPVVLLLAFCFYYLTSVLFSAVLGSHPSISHMYIYLFAGGFAALFFSHEEGKEAIRAARTAIFSFLLISAFYTLIQPEMVLLKPYQGVIPFLTVRYYGLGHANTTGSLTVMFLFCLWNSPYDRNWLNKLAWLVGLASLFFSQSKTSWIAFIIGMISLCYFEYREVISSSLTDFKRPHVLAITIIVSLVFLLANFCYIMFSSSYNFLDSFFVSKAGSDLMSMTGRTQIWQIAVQEWQRSPLFGYGLTIFDEVHRDRIGMSSAVTAHSQFYQILGSSGIVGIIGLFIYVVALIFFTLKTTPASRGLTLAFFLFLVIKSLSEVPLTMIGYYGADEITHLLFLMIIAAYYGQPSRQSVQSSKSRLSLVRAM